MKLLGYLLAVVGVVAALGGGGVPFDLFGGLAELGALVAVVGGERALDRLLALLHRLRCPGCPFRQALAHLLVERRVALAKARELVGQFDHRALADLIALPR